MKQVAYFFIRLLLSFIVFFLAFNIVQGQQVTLLPKDKQEVVYRYLELVQRYRQAGNTEQAIFYLNRVAFVYWENGGLREAVTYFLESVPLNEKVGNLSDIRAIYSNIGLIYTDLGRYDLALENFYKSLDARRKMNNKAEIAAGLYDVAFIHGSLRQHDKAIPLLEEALEISRSLGNSRLTLNCLSLLGFNFDRIGNIAKAQEANRLFTEIERQLARQDVKEEYEELVGKTQAQVEREKMERARQTFEMEIQKLRSQATQDSLSFVVKAKADSLKTAEEISLQRAKDIELLETKQRIQELAQSEAQAKLRVQQTIIYGGAGGLALLFLLSMFIYRGYNDKRKANKLLNVQNIEIQNQRDKIQFQNENITKSINYAQGIQKALLPPQSTLSEYLIDSFIFFKPRDVVSGDYYWFKPIIADGDQYNRKTDKFAIAAIDCTGHGVPGAFLSMIGYNLLNEIIDKGVSDPGQILHELNIGIINTLRQETTDNQDGMDMALCVIDPLNRKVEYAGAKNPLVYISNGNLERIRGDKLAIGGSANRSARYTTHTIYVPDQTWFYLFSDGYIDQFGGEQGRKFMIKKFCENLLDIHIQPGCDQRNSLINAFNEWRADQYPQVDDVLVIGFMV